MRGAYPPMTAPQGQPVSATLPGESEAASEKERIAYRDIYALFAKQAYEAASLRIREFERRYPQSGVLPQLNNIQGLIHLFNKQPMKAQHLFNKALQSNKDRRFRQFVLFNLGAALVETQSYVEALKALDEINPEVLDGATQIKFYYLRGLLKQRLNSPNEAILALLLGSRLLPPWDPANPPTEETKAPNQKLYEAEAELSLRQISDYSTLESFYRDNQSSTLAPQLLGRLAKVATETNRAAMAEVYVKTLLSQYPDTPQATQARELESTITKLTNVSGRTVGVLLPLTGKFSRFGTQCRQGVELGFGKNDTLVFEDSGDTPEQAIKALDSLVLDKKAVAVIGPLLSKGVEQVTARAQSLGVPLISLAQQAGVVGDYVFRATNTPAQQVDAIATYAVKELGLKKFAILYPKGKFGQEYADAFWDKIESLDGEIVGVEAYPSSETDFRSAVDKLAGLFYSDARYRELNDLAKKRQDAKITKRTRKTEELFALKPLVDFDAVFIPDEGRTVGQALPFFHYRDIDSAKFLGISAWNTPTLNEKLAAQGFETYFVDTFALDSPPVDYREFLAKYQQAYDSRPSAMEALAFDVGAMTASILRRNEGDLSRSQMRELLADTKNFPGATGRMSYLNGEFTRPLKVLSLTKHGITEVKKTSSR